MGRGNSEDDTPLLEKAMDNWNGFRQFMWNSEERTVMGRGGKSWAKISLFYLVFYTCLAGFWAALLAIFLQVSVSYDRPKWTAYVSTPGLTSVPVPDDQNRIRWTPANEDSVKRVTAGMLDIYEMLMLNDPDFVDCTNLGVGSVEDGQRFCKFDVTSLGECNKPPNFGWDTLKPCVFLRLNRVYNWRPENYESAGDVPERIRPVYLENNVAINCFARREADMKNLNSTAPFPSAGIPFGFFPHLLGANSEDKGRLIQPIVAVQLSLTPNVAVQVECQTYTGNISPRGGLFDTDDESQARIYLTARQSDD